jgi:hypothetical protein
MARAVADPEELRKFAHALLRSIGELRTLRAEVMGRFEALHDHWQDEKYSRFRECFAATMRRMEPFLEQGQAYVEHLHRKAQLLEEYLRRRY